MFNLPEFHEVQKQHCKDLLAEAERERLALESQKGQQPGKLSQLAQELVSRLSGNPKA